MTNNTECHDTKVLNVRITSEQKEQIIARSREMGFLRPSEYIRFIIGRDLASTND